MREELTSIKVAERICHRLNLPTAEHAEGLEPLVLDVITGVRDDAIAAARTASIEIAEDEAGRCRNVGATAAEQIALNIAARIRRRHVEA